MTSDPGHNEEHAVHWPHHHLTLPIHDLDVAERFYVGVLGAELVRKFDRATFLRYSPERGHEVDADNSPLHLAVKFGGGPDLDLFLHRNRPKSTPRPHPHLAMRVEPSQLDGFADRLRSAGVPIDGPRRLGPPGHASIYFADPSGNLLELVTMAYAGPVEMGPPDVAKLVW